MNKAKSYPKAFHRREKGNKHEIEPPGTRPGARGAPGALRWSVVCVYVGGVGREKGHFFAKEALRRCEIAWKFLEMANMGLGLQYKLWSGVTQAEFGSLAVLCTVSPRQVSSFVKWSDNFYLTGSL